MKSKSTSSPGVREPLAAGILLRRPRGHPEVQVVCGYRPCAAKIATLARDSRDTSRHLVELDAMLFEEPFWGGVPTVELRKRVAHQWERAKKEGRPWSTFRPLSRRPYGPMFDGRRKSREIDDLGVRMVIPLPPSPFSFECPVCERPNLAAVPEECGRDCPFHCPRCGGARPAVSSEGCVFLDHDGDTFQPCPGR
jgi:hypothetical protein